MNSTQRVTSDDQHVVFKAVTLCALLLLAFAFPTPSQGDILVKGPSSERAQQICVPLPGDALLDATVHWQLIDVDDDARRFDAQLVPAVAADGTPLNSQQLMLATIPGSPHPELNQEFRLKETRADQRASADGFQLLEENGKSLKFLENQQPVMTYNFDTITDNSVPESNKRRSRACYIHPIWGMHGEILTDDFPKDHYHHHGAFWCWPHVMVDGQTYDLWTYSNIHHRFVRWLHRQADPVAARIGVENGWYVGDQKVMTERVWITAFRSEQNSRAIDVSLTLIAADRPVTLQGADLKSYGGLTLRYDVLPRTDSTVRVPGRTLEPGEDLLNTPLAWADLSSQFPGARQRSGASVFIHPDHPDYPPTWLTRHYGALCVGWPGLVPQTLEPGQPVTLQYRLWVHGHEESPETIAHVYSTYCRSQSDNWQVE
jgi:hypothetical protein